MSARWDIFAKVIDNFGDAGVAWRLARILAREHGLDVSLYLDDLVTLARFVPGVLTQASEQRVDSVRIVRWREPLPGMDDADVVVEAFGCGVPDAYLSRAAQRASPPRWFVLEYLSAERWVDDMQGLPSPHPHLPIMRRFWFPGFTERSGGLLRERGLFAARDTFQTDEDEHRRWWRAIGVVAPESALRVSLFCYPNAKVWALLDSWADGDTPVVCVVPQGVASGELDRWSGGAVPHPGGPPLIRDHLQLHVIPFMAHDEYDRLLWGCDVNFVRGEDSFVRALWAARPFVWQAYPQEGDAHRAKVAAFEERYTAHVEANAARAFRGMIDAWNGRGDSPDIAAAWTEFVAAIPDLIGHGRPWADELARLPELATGMVEAALAKAS